MKAILVIDKPESCTSCLLGIYNKKWFCLKTNKEIDIIDRYNIPDWCPLKLMPSKKVPTFDPNSVSYDEEYEKRIMYEIDGYNRCIDEILGETE